MLMASAALVVIIGFLHSFLGERHIVRPLVALELIPGLRLSRTFVRRTIRFAWHVTTIAWLGLAAVLVCGDTPAVDVTAVILGVTSLFVLVASRGAHFAWLMFALASIAAVIGAHGDATWLVTVGSVSSQLCVGTLCLLSALHVYWAAGGRWGVEGAVPRVNGKPMFVPGRWITLLVAAGLLTFAAALYCGHIAWPILSVAALAFGARTIGDLRYVGLFKKGPRSRFTELDDSLYTPLCFIFAVVFSLAAA